MSSSSRSPILGIVFLVMVAAVAVVGYRMFTDREVVPGETGPSEVPGTEPAPTPRSEVVDDSIGIDPQRLREMGPETVAGGISFTISCFGAAGASEPLAGVEVAAIPTGRGVAPRTDQAVNAVTDARGLALFTGLPYKAYRVSAEPEGSYPLILNRVESGDVKELIFGSPVEFTGKVIASDTRGPIADAFLNVYSGLEGRLVSIRMRNTIASGQADPKVDPLQEGSYPRFQKTLVTSETGEFALKLPTGYPVQVSIEHASYDPFQESFDAEEGQDILGREYVLIPRTEIFGIVVDDVTGQPVPGVTVEAGESGVPVAMISQLGGGNEIFSSESDAEGKYRLTNIPRGKQHITATHPEYDEFGGGFTITEVEPYEYEIRLKRSAVIAGRVVDASNRPVQGAQVFWILPTAMIFGNNATAGRLGVATAADGSFSIADAPIERGFNIVVKHPDFIETTESNVVLQAGENLTGMEIVLARGGSITGRVTSASSSEPLADAIITARPIAPPGSSLPRIKSAEDGTFAVTNTSPGKYELTCDMEGYCPQTVTNLSDIITGVQFTLVREAVFAGTILNATTGEPVEKFNIRAKPSMGGKRSDVISSSVRDKNGQFEIRGLRPGSWDFEFTADEIAPHVVEGVAMAEGAEVRDQVLHATQGARAVGRISGVSGKPIGYALVRFEYLETFLPTDKTYFSLQAQTDTNGEYSVPRLRPGRYKVWATHPQYAQAKEQEIYIEDGPETRVDLRLPRPSKLILFVRDENGNTVPGAKAALFRGTSPLDSAERTNQGGAGSIQLPTNNNKSGIGVMDDAGSHKGFNVPVGASGELTWYRKEPGEWTLWVTAPGFDRYERTLILRAGVETVEEAILLPRGTSKPADEGSDEGGRRRDRRNRSGGDDGGDG